MRAVILSIGDELVLGQTVDTNSAWISQQMARHGVGTLYHQTVADDLEAITTAIRRAAEDTRFMVISGGLGPTDDDLTREALAAAMGVELVLHEPSVDHLKNFFERRGRPMPERNRCQAMHPAGSDVIPNSCGTAPGIHATIGECEIYVTPGVPSEMHVMFESAVLPALEKYSGVGRTILTHKVNTFGRGESDVAEMLGDLMRRDANPTVGTTVSGGEVAVRVRVEGTDPKWCEAELKKTIKAVETAMSPYAYGRDEGTLQSAVINLLQHKNLSVATAESCTGGMIAKMLTDVAGCSSVVKGGWVTYSNDMKTFHLGVDTPLLQEHGAVSEAVARAMAKGALTGSAASVAISTTGIAGPTGGTDEKPVGTVWLGMAWKVADEDAAKAAQTQPFVRVDESNVATAAVRLQLNKDREVVRLRASLYALQMLRFHALGEPLDKLFRAAASKVR